MQPGDSEVFTFELLDADGSPVTGEAANLSAAVFLGGAADSTSTTVAEIGTTGRYGVTITNPSTVGQVLVLILHSGSHTPSPSGYAYELESYDTTAVAGLLLQSAGTVTATSQASTDLGEVVDGDSWGTGTLTAALGKLTKVGLSDLSGGTLSAAFKQDPDDTPVTAGITAAITDAGNREFNVSWTTFPAGMALAATAERAAWYLDVQFKHTSSGKIVTIFRGSLVVVWERDETT